MFILSKLSVWEANRIISSDSIQAIREYELSQSEVH